MKLRSSCCLILLLCAATLLRADSSVPWHELRYATGGGYWPVRLPIAIANPAENAVAGEPVAVAVPMLAGQRVESLRVCNSTGVELLFDLIDASGHQKRQGQIAPDDQVIIPVECAAKGSTRAFVYAGNELTLPLADFLATGLVNGDFEAGATGPEGWVSAETDAQHRVAWEKSAGRNGSRCVKVEVDPAAPASWVKWCQHKIPVIAGRSYKLTGWVRAEEVSSDAGWFIHVGDDKSLLLNKSIPAGKGSFDWKQVSLNFTAPANATSAMIGTLLHGTGRAWFDDLRLELVDDGKGLHASAGALEKLQLSKCPPAKELMSQDWPWGVTVRVRNFTDQAVEGTLIHADLSSALARLRLAPTNALLQVTDAASGQVAGTCVRIGDGVLFDASLPAKSEREFVIAFHATQKESPEAFQLAYEKLMANRLNLAPNPDFELGSEKPEGWMSPTIASGSKLVAGFSSEAKCGKRSVMVSVPAEAPRNWIGWRSKPIPVQANASYFYGGFMKCKGLTGNATLHAHQLDRDGKMTTGGSQSGRSSVEGDKDWTFCSSVIQMGPNSASLQLHLTMNERGTLFHDGIVLCRVMEGSAANVTTLAAADQSAGLRVWQQNPLVKLFQDSPAGPAISQVEAELARNEFEPFELGLRNCEACGPVEITVSALHGANGAALPAVKVDRVGFVPVDYPGNYCRTEAAVWQRPLPSGRAETDGWAGWWPDPLMPVGTFDLAANRTQPVWFTVHAPRDAAPGDYQGEIRISAGSQRLSLPLRVKVLPFALPDRTQLKVMFDLRSGRGGDYGAGIHTAEGRHKWYQFIADHRMGADHIDPPPHFTYKQGKVTMDATEFDVVAHYYFDELGIKVCYTPDLFYGFGWAYTPKKLFGLEPFTPEYIDAFKQAYGLFVEHVKQKGWHDRFVYYMSDEPHFHQPHVVEQMKKLCALVHEVDTTIPIYSSTWRYCPQWDDALDLWGIGQYGCFPLPDMERLQKSKKHFLFTCDGQIATDTPYLATERMLPYYCFKYGVEGFEYWGISWWTYDPWKFGWHTFIRQSDDGKNYYWIRYPNGDGFLTYPGASVGIDGPASSIRLEEIREGLEDYEALQILTGLAAKAKESGRSCVAAEQALAMARDLVVMPNAGGLRSTAILPDPDRIGVIRKAVNAAIVQLMAK